MEEALQDTVTRIRTEKFHARNGNLASELKKTVRLSFARI